MHVVFICQANNQKQSKSDDVLNCQCSMATFSTSERKNRPRGDRKTEEMAIHLKQSLSAAIMLELYDKSQIDVYVEILEVIFSYTTADCSLVLIQFAKFDFVYAGGRRYLLCISECCRIGSGRRWHLSAGIRMRVHRIASQRWYSIVGRVSHWRG